MQPSRTQQFGHPGLVGALDDALFRDDHVDQIGRCHVEQRLSALPRQHVAKLDIVGRLQRQVDASAGCHHHEAQPMMHGQYRQPVGADGIDHITVAGDPLGTHHHPTRAGDFHQVSDGGIGMQHRGQIILAQFQMGNRAGVARVARTDFHPRYQASPMGGPDDAQGAAMAEGKQCLGLAIMPADHLHAQLGHGAAGFLVTGVNGDRGIGQQRRHIRRHTQRPPQPILQHSQRPAEVLSRGPRRGQQGKIRAQRLGPVRRLANAPGCQSNAVGGGNAHGSRALHRAIANGFGYRQGVTAFDPESFFGQVSLIEDAQIITAPLQGLGAALVGALGLKLHERLQRENVIIPRRPRPVSKCRCPLQKPEGILRAIRWTNGGNRPLVNTLNAGAGRGPGGCNEGIMMTLNVDRAEIAKFEALASRWWDRESEFKPLHEINPLRTNWIDEKSALAGKEVLDVGCGGGILAEAMAQRGARVTGIDMGEAPLSVARLHQLESGVEVEYQQCTAEEMAELHPGRFDVVTCMEMLEHVPDPASVIRACATLVKPGGQVFFSTINRNPKSFAFAIVGAEYVLRMLPRGTHEYAKFIRPAELGSWSRAAGLDMQDIIGLTYNPLLRHYKLANDVDVNYMIHCQRGA